MKRISPAQAISVVALLVSLAALGLGVSAAREMPIRVPAGGHHLRMSIQGTGSPTVLLESFGPAGLETWNRIQPEIARFTRVVSYDHAGYGGSQPGPKPRDATQIADELLEALRNANVPPPYLLVGYSFGGPYVRVFAGENPNEVVGFVFVDPTQESFMALLNERFPELNVVTDEHRREQGEWGMQWASLNQARDTQLPEVPITLITGAKTHDLLSRHLLPLWQAEHAKWLSQFPKAKHVVTTHSGHGVVFTEPELVIEAVREMVGRARADAPPP